MDKKKSEVKCDNCEAKREKDCICPSPSLYGGVGSEDKRVQREIRDELGCCGGDYCTGSAAHNDRLIAFIRSHDQQLRQRIVEGVLEDYSSWLDKHGYMDSDWYTEEPKTTEAYLKSKSYKTFITNL